MHLKTLAFLALLRFTSIISAQATDESGIDSPVSKPRFFEKVVFVPELTPFRLPQVT